MTGRKLAEQSVPIQRLTCTTGGNARDRIPIRKELP